MTAPRSWAAHERPTHGRPAQRSRDVRRLAARQVDEVRLADRLGMAGVVGVDPVADQHRLDLGPERREVGSTLRRPAVEDLGAVGPRRGRQDDDPRPGASRGGEQPCIEVRHRGQELARPHEGDWSRHAREHSGACAKLPR